LVPLELNPRRGGQLPPALSSMMVASPNLFLKGFLGFFGVLAVGTSLGGAPPLLLLAPVVAIALALAGSWWIERQGGVGHWVLERRPDLVAGRTRTGCRFGTGRRARRRCTGARAWAWRRAWW